MRPLITLLALLILATPATAQKGAEYMRGLLGVTLLGTLNMDLLTHDSATAVLQDLCSRYGPAGTKITAIRVQGPDKRASDDVMTALRPSAEEHLNYRRVRLACGTHVLSEADNWYRPSRLTPDMNRTLDTGDTPFGVAVRSLNFRRQNVGVEILWRPLPDTTGKTMSSNRPVTIPAEILRHRAVLSMPDGTPFSYVIETYSGQTVEMALAKMASPKR
jgi:chorismate-pyruvate lyase